MTTLREPRVARVLLLSALASQLSCFATPVTEKYFYDLTLPSTLVQGIGGHSVAVTDFTASPGYDDDQIVYRVSENELRYYGYRSWVAEPRKLLGLAVIRHLRAFKGLGRVDTDERLPRADAQLEGNVDAIEELDDGHQTRARLAMSFVVRASSGDHALLRYAFDERRLCARRHPREIARGVSEILEIQIKILAKRIAAALERQPALAPPPTMP